MPQLARLTDSRSPSELIMGLWAAIAAFGLPLVGILWWRDVPRLFVRLPVPPHVFLAFVIVGLASLVSVLAAIEDIWERPLDSNEQVMWMLLTCFAPPYGGLAYWWQCCHSTLPPRANRSRVEWYVTLRYGGQRSIQLAPSYRTPRSRRSASRRSTASGASSGRRIRSGDVGAS